MKETIRVTCETKDYLPLDRLTPFQGELKSLSKDAFGKLKKSIIKHGITFPVFVWKQNGHNNILDGTQRDRVLAAMSKEGYEIPDVPVVYVDAQDAREAKEKILLLSSQYGRMDDESLHEFIELAELDFTELKELIDLPQLDLNKFERSYYGADVEEGPEPRMDEAEALRAKYGVELGQVWELGEHRLMCGDSTSAENVACLLQNAKPFIMVTDPPYGVEYDPAWRLDAGLNKPWQTRAEGMVENDNQIDWTPSYAAFPGFVAYVWHAGRHASELVQSLRTAKFEIRTQIIWSKPSLVIGRGHYHWQHEPCWYAVRPGSSAKWCGDRTQSTVWDIPNMHRTQGSVDDGKTEHGTQKPIECMARPIRNHGGKDDDVYDPFLGSGTTLIACEQLGRRCYAMEISPAYVAVAIQRWVDLTGKEPKRING